MKTGNQGNEVGQEKILYKELSFKIVQASYEVHNVLGPGFPEKIYEEAMAVELTADGVGIERQRLVEVLFKGTKVGEYRLDMVAEQKIVLEFKAVAELNAVFEAQVLSYLKASGLTLGLLINFGGKKVEVRRIVN